MSNHTDMNPEDQAARRPRSATLRPLMQLTPFIVKYKMMICGALTALIIATLATLAIPIAARFMIDYGFSGADAELIDQYFLAMLGVAITLGLASASRFYFVTLLGERVTADLRHAVYAHLLRLTPSFFERTRTGEILSRLTADTTLIRTVLASSASVALRNMFLLAGAMIMLIQTDPKLSGFAALTLPAVLIPIIGFGRLVRRLARYSQDRLADTSAHAAQTLNAIPVVQAFTHEPQDEKLFSAAVEDSFIAAKSRTIARSLLTATAIVLVFAGVVGILWLGAQYVLDGTMSAGRLGQFILYAVLGATALGALSEVWGDIQQAAGATERLVELLTITPDIAPPDKPARLAYPVSGRITLENVSFAYPQRPETLALNDVSFTINPGETIALVGPSGAGKSTIFQLLCRFYDPQKGNVRLDNINIAKCDPYDIRRNLAWVPQDTKIFNMSVAENIRFGASNTIDQIDDTAIIEAAHAANATQFIETLPQAYATELGEHGASLSGGQRQRLAIARAIIRRAPILLLDEATSALDAKSEALIQDALTKLMQTGSLTTLVIAHRLATVRNADRIILLDEGRIIASGSHNQLLKKNALYKRLAELQFNADIIQ